ncbi:MAG: hypothetical protein HQM00_05145 [Magnetococcales bacterium]|nr:hypothetical protein [Magnetococcales bacterium]
MASQHPESRSLRKLLLWGAASVTLYALLLIFEQTVLAWSSRGGWYFIFPVLIAFAFSIVHGRFTGEFWESLGVRAKQ